MAIGITRPVSVLVCSVKRTEKVKAMDTGQFQPMINSKNMYALADEPTDK